MKLLLDNSAINLLHCKRLFQLTVIQGLQGDKPDTEIGSAGHTLVEHLDKGASVDDAILAMTTKHGSDIPQSKILMAASMYRGAVRMPPAITIDGVPAIEYKFKFHYGSFVHPSTHELIEVWLLGTIDRIYIDPATDRLVIVDYKWSYAVNPSHRDNIINAHDLSFQLPFYVFALMKMGTFPAQYMAYLEEGKYRVELHFVFFNCDPPMVKRHKRDAFRDEFIRREVPAIVNAKIEEAIKIATHEGVAVHDGMLVYGACGKCQFKVACMDMGSEKEIEYLSRLPRRVYDPMTFR